MTDGTRETTPSEVTAVELRFAQVTPLLDDVIARVASFGLSPYEDATIAALAATHLSSMTALAMVQSRRPIAPDKATCERLSELLSSKVREADIVINAALERVEKEEDQSVKGV